MATFHLQHLRHRLGHSNSYRWLIFELLEDDDTPTSKRLVVDGILAAVIVMAVATTILQTVPELNERFGPIFRVIEIVVTVVFSAEYVLRIWSVVEDRAGRYAHPLWGRLRYMVTPMALVDLLAILPFYLAFWFADNFLFLRALRLIRVVKLARYSPAIALFEVVVYNQRGALAAGATIIGSAVVVLSGLAYLAEGRVQPESFGTIPLAMWWTVITMTTVGYGDVTPLTIMGRIIAALTSFLGISMFAFPTAILGAGFAEELQKRNFNKLAAMVARIPAFGHLTTAQLADLVGSLHLRHVPPRYHVLRRGEHADSMYFIDSGQIVVRQQDRGIRLGPGEFFGEAALLAGDRRRATAITLSACTILELRAGDFHRLLDGDPKLREVIEQKAPS